MVLEVYLDSAKITLVRVGSAYFLHQSRLPGPRGSPNMTRKAEIWGSKVGPPSPQPPLILSSQRVHDVIWGGGLAQLGMDITEDTMKY
jgi:hypothetical protein